MPIRIAFVAAFFAVVGACIVATVIEDTSGMWWLGVPLIITGLGLFLRQRWVRAIGSLNIFVGYILCVFFLSGFFLPGHATAQKGQMSFFAPFEIRALAALTATGILTWAYGTLWSRACSVYLKATQVEDQQSED